MPKASTITKEIVLDAAFEIVRTSGFPSLSARSIAQHIGCSTQPIYWVYENMNMLRQDIAQRAVFYLNNIIENYHQTGHPFADIGLGYIYIAHKETFLFKALYTDNIMNIKLTDLLPNIMAVNALKRTETADNLEEIAIKGWIFAHGIASLIAAGMMVYDSKKIEKMLLSFME